MKMKRIRILGIGGQGIAFSGWLLGYAATHDGLFSAVHHSYGAEVRGGSVISNIVISEEPIVNPYIDDFDLYLLLNSIGWKFVKSSSEAVYIADNVIARDNFLRGLDIEWLPFDKLSHQEDLPINVMALGYLSKKDVISFDALERAIIQRKKDVERNIKALKLGYKLDRVDI